MDRHRPAGLCVSAGFETLNRALATPLVEDTASITIGLISAACAGAADAGHA
jgi:hypothetical protein